MNEIAKSYDYEWNDPLVLESLKAIPVVWSGGVPAKKSNKIYFDAEFEDDLELITVDVESLNEIFPQLEDLDNELSRYKGNILNMALEILCKKYCLEKPFWSPENTDQLETLADKGSVEGIGLANLHRLILALLKLGQLQSQSRHQKHTRTDANRFYLLLESSIPHSFTLKSIWDKSNNYFANLFRCGDGSASPDSSHPIYCLFDIIYLSLQVHTMKEDDIALKECRRCHRLFFANDLGSVMCDLDTPVTTCSDEEIRERSRLRSRIKQKLKEIKRLIADNSDLMDVDKNGDPRLFSEFKADFDIYVCEPIPRNSANGINELEKRLRYLEIFQDSYTSSKEMVDVVEASKEAADLN